MRTITDHIVDGDQAVQLEIKITDQAGAGGANQRYEVTGFDATNNPSNFDRDEEVTGPKKLTVLFQNGPIKEHGMNGITQEALAAIIIDRLRSFQSGPFACLENQAALDHFESGLRWLQKRTVDRIRRGVVGVNKA